MKSKTTTIQVRYGETDAMRIAHHGSYLGWFEVGRVEFMRSMGLSYRELEKEGTGLPVIEARLRYFSPARFDETIEIETFVKTLTRTTVTFGYILRNSRNTNMPLAVGYTVHPVVGPTGRPVRISGKVETILKNLAVPKEEQPDFRWAAQSEN